MKAMVDTNILIDCFARREPFSDDARKFLAFGALGEYELWIGSSQITDLFYILCDGGKAKAAKEAQRKIVQLRKHVHVVSVGEPEVDAALQSAWPDFEDACLYQAALKLKADVIVTRDRQGFKRSSIRALDAVDFFKMLEQHQGISYEELFLAV